MTEAYPLKWPSGWPRLGGRENDSRFRGPTYRWDRVYNELIRELKKIGATSIVVSTNQPIRQDGMPYAQTRNIDDVGVAVYFTRNGKQLVMAQDRFWSIIGNMRSLTMAIEGLRQMERHGGAVMLERAFDGFAALPPPRSCWDILGIGPTPPQNINRDLVMGAFRERAKEWFDTGADMDRLVKARDEALRQIA